MSQELCDIAIDMLRCKLKCHPCWIVKVQYRLPSPMANILLSENGYYLTLGNIQLGMRCRANCLQ